MLFCSPRTFVQPCIRRTEGARVADSECKNHTEPRSCSSTNALFFWRFTSITKLIIPTGAATLSEREDKSQDQQRLCSLRVTEILAAAA